VTLLNVTLVPAPDRVVVRLHGDVDLSTGSVLTDALGRAARLSARLVIVDVAAARFWDCSGLRALTAFTAELAQADRACRLVGAPATTRRLIGAAGLTDSLDLDGPIDADGDRRDQASASSLAMSSAERRNCAAPRFSVRCSTDLVPGMGSTTGDFCSSHASAT
jgi:anti-anti-sigma factor